MDRLPEFVRRPLAIFVVDGDLEGAQEAVVLGCKFDLSGGFVRPLLGLLCRVGLLVVVFLVFVSTIEANRRFQNEKYVVAGSFDFADRFRDAV